MSELKKFHKKNSFTPCLTKDTVRRTCEEAFVMEVECVHFETDSENDLSSLIFSLKCGLD